MIYERWTPPVTIRRRTLYRRTPLPRDLLPSDFLRKKRSPRNRPLERVTPRASRMKYFRVLAWPERASLEWERNGRT